MRKCNPEHHIASIQGMFKVALFKGNEPDYRLWKKKVAIFWCDTCMSYWARMLGKVVMLEKIKK